MQIHKNEITTGILVLVTSGILIAVLIVIGMPGVIKPLNTYRLYYDNANGIRPGAPVFLAGREIGKVTVLQSPVALDQRPKDHADYEVSIDVQVEKDAQIYRKVTVRLAQQGLMGLQAIDFVQGEADSGLAENHTEFVGERVPDLAESMNNQLTRLTGPDSDLAATIKNTKIFIESLNKSPIQETIKNAKQFTDTLNSQTGPDSDLAVTIKKSKTFVESLNKSPVQETIKNAEQLTDTLKKQPWRLFWPSTKSYPAEDKPAVETRKESDSAKKKVPRPSATPPPPKRRGR